MKRKNGKIELMRFVMILLVVLFHMNTTLSEEPLRLTEHLTFFQQGYIGVEFFFLVSGYLMARSFYQREELPGKNYAPADTLHFLRRKLNAFLPYHLAGQAFALALVLSMHPANLPAYILHKLPGLFLVQRIGVWNDSILPPEWYLSSMLLAMAVLHPLLLRFRHWFSQFAAPLAALLLLGYLSQTGEGLSGTDLWSGLTYRCNLRAAAELCLGLACYEAGQALESRSFALWQRLLLTAAELGGYLTAVWYACADAPDLQYDFYILFCLAVSVTLSFSDVGLIRADWFCGSLWAFLGGISLPVYIIHSAVKRLDVFYFSQQRVLWQVLFIFFGSILLGAVLYLGWNALSGRGGSREPKGTGTPPAH